MSERMFPVLWPHSLRETARLRSLGCPRSVPWAMLAPHKRRAELNHSQTLERLAERGGLSPSEIVCVLQDRKLFPVPEDADCAAVPALLDAITRFAFPDTTDRGPS